MVSIKKVRATEQKALFTSVCTGFSLETTAEFTLTQLEGRRQTQHHFTG